MKRLIMFICVIVILVPNQCFAMELSAKSAVLIDGESGRVLYSKNSKNKMGMASTTKIMTALVVLEKYKSGDIITASNKAANTEGSSIYLKPGEKMSIEHVLYGLMLASGNDASVALAEHIGGNEYKFVELMNNKVLDIGLTDTHFKNPNGLPDDNHYTTAYDLAIITREAMKNDIFREIVSTKNKVLKSLSGENDRYVKNHNKLLWQYDNCIGVKTGFTKKDGRCLVSSAEKDGINLIAVTLNAPNDWEDHIKMLDYGFGCLKRKKIITAGKPAGEILVVDGVSDKLKCVYDKDFYVNLKDKEMVQKKIHLPKKAIAPIKKGEQVGYVEIYIDGKFAGDIAISTSESVSLTNKNKLIQQFVNLISKLI